MPTTRKQKKARKSRGLEMLSDIESLDIMLGENHFNAREREGSLNSNLPRRSRSSVSNESENENGNIGRNQRNVNSRTNTECDRNLVTGTSSAEINRLSSELNSRISREMDEMMNSVSAQIQRAISDAISTQVLSQIQNVIMDGSGHGTRKGWDVPSERPELNSDVQRNLNAKNSLRNEQDENQLNNDYPELNVHDMVTGDNESPNQVPEFLTGRIPSRTQVNQSYEDINLDTTIPAHERFATAADLDPITRLADVLTTVQNRPTAQQLTIRPVNSNTMTSDGKSEKFELFEDLFHTMIKMQPEMTEQMKINDFHSLLRKNALQTFRNINSTNRQTLEDVLVIFRRKYVKPESQATAKHKWHRPVFDPNTMKLPDFLEELNQDAEKAFGEHAQKMIDSLLYAKLPPKLKRSVNMARLENGSYDEIVAHLERELELNALEESDELPMATMTSASAKPKTPLSTGQMSDITCNYCKEKGHMVKDCEKLKKKNEKDAQQGKSTQKKTYPECGTCGEKNHPEERCWQGAGAHLKPKRTRPEDSNDNKPTSKAQKPQTKTTSSSSQSSSSNDESKKLTSPRLQYNELISVRQYIRSDPPTQTFHQYNQQLMGYPSVVWQQQMEKATIITYNNTHLFQKPIPVWGPDVTTTFTTRFRPIPLIEDYNPTYIDPDYGRDPYWDTEIYNQDLLQFQYVLDDIEHYNKTVHESPPITHNK